MPRDDGGAPTELVPARKQTVYESGSGPYRRRWTIERLFAWLFCCLVLVTRYEHKAENCLGLVQLACARILWRH